MKVILYFYPNDSSFVRKDLAILEAYYHVKRFKFETRNKWIAPWLFFSQGIFLLLNLPSANVVITQFAGYHSFLPNLLSIWFNRPSLMILGGFECASFPSIHYGAYRKKVLGKFTRWSFQLAQHLSPVHESMVLYKHNYSDSDYPYQGFEYFNGKVDVPLTTIYNGFESDKFFNKKEIRIKNSFITVSVELTGVNYQLKGIDLIVDVALKFPESTFTIIGNGTGLRSEVSSNVKIVPPVANDKLVDYFNKHEFYLQLSMSEGFPNALCEAMMCGCIPIGSDVTSIPFIIGDTGYVLKKRDGAMLSNLITTALDSDKRVLSERASARIMSEFSFERRQRELLALVAKIEI